ncbi:MAG: hypothetical protein M1836_004955 [Candelina mexicana]|nr:MAG: hypothetical protein M1836_004955 [Candelina mexicana]
MIWCLNKFAVDADNSGGWVERTFNGKRAGDASVKEWIFGPNGLLETATIGSWDKLLRYSAPVYQLSEGFCSLLVIQAAGQISRWMVNRGRSDSWMFPEIGNVDATLIGATITCAVFLCAWGIGSGKGNPVESSLLVSTPRPYHSDTFTHDLWQQFAYIVLCIYQIFTDYQPSFPDTVPPPPPQPDFPPFPPIVMASYSTLVYVLSTLPSTIHAAFNFLTAAFSTITPSVIISLAYRLFVLYASTRIIPAIRESGARALSQEPSLEDSDGAGQVLGFLSYFSPSILVAVYTSLLMQHFASTSLEGTDGEWWTSQGGDAGGNVWRWINVGGTMALYALELYLGKEDIDGGLTGHWKAD